MFLTRHQLFYFFFRFVNLAIYQNYQNIRKVQRTTERLSQLYFIDTLRNIVLIFLYDL